MAKKKMKVGADWDDDKAEPTTPAKGGWDDDKDDPVSTTPVAGFGNARRPHSMKRLIREVTEMFPETVAHPSLPNRFGVFTAVAFDVRQAPGLTDVLHLLGADPRVHGVQTIENGAMVRVYFWDDAAKYDSHDSFAAAEVLIELAGKGSE